MKRNNSLIVLNEFIDYFRDMFLGNIRFDYFEIVENKKEKRIIIFKIKSSIYPEFFKKIKNFF